MAIVPSRRDDARRLFGDPGRAGGKGLKAPSDQKGCPQGRAHEERWRQQMQAADSDKAAYQAVLTDIMPLLRAVAHGVAPRSSRISFRTFCCCCMPCGTPTTRRAASCA